MTDSSPRIIRVAVWVLLSLALAGCQRCGDEGVETAWPTLVPAEARQITWVPKLASLVRSVDAFSEVVAKTVGPQKFMSLRASFKAEFGLDPLEPADYEKVGLDPSSPLLFYTVRGRRRGVVVASVRDADAWTSFVGRTVERLDGATRRQERTIAGVTVTTFGRPFGSETVPSLHVAIKNRIAMVAMSGGVQDLEQLLGRLEAKTKPAPGAWQSWLVRVPTGSFGTWTQTLRKDGSAAVTSSIGALNEQGFQLTGWLHTPETSVKKALAGTSQRPPSIWISDDSVLAGGTNALSLEAIELLGHHPWLSRATDRVFAELGRATGLKPRTELIPSLKGDAVLGLAVADLSALPKLVRRGRLGSELMRLFPTSFVATVRDSKAFQAMLERSFSFLNRETTRVQRRTLKIGDRTAILYESIAGNMGWGLVGDAYVYASGAGRLDAQVTRVVSPPEKHTWADRSQALGTHSVYLDLDGKALTAGLTGVAEGEKNAEVSGIMRTVQSGLGTMGAVTIAVDPDPLGLKVHIQQTFR